jgi:hypothetical protein
MEIPNANKYTTNKSTPIKNGCCRTRTGSRQVLTSNLFEVRPILRANYSGYQPERGTIQIGPVKGDLLFQCVWGGRNPEGSFTILQWNGEDFVQVPLISQGNLWKAAQAAIPWMEEFVAPHGRQSSFIPLEGDTLAEAAKRRRLTKFFERYQLPFEADGFMQSPGRGLQMEPRKFEGDLREYIPKKFFWDVSVVGISQSEKWFSWDGQTSHEITIHPDIESGSNYAHSKTYRETGKPLDIPEGSKMMIRIGFGQYIKDHHSYGRTIDIYDVG